MKFFYYVMNLSAMNRSNIHKLSYLSDEQIAIALARYDIDNDTGEEDENEDDLEEVIEKSDMTLDECLDKALGDVVEMSDSALLTDICLSSNSPTLLSPSTSMGSCTPPTSKRKRSVLRLLQSNNRGEYHANQGSLESKQNTLASVGLSTPPGPSQKRRIVSQGKFIKKHAKFTLNTDAITESTLDINPKSNAFKRILWRQNNLVIDKSEIAFSDNDMGNLKDLDTPYKCFEYFVNDEFITHIVEQTNLYATQKNIGTLFSTNNVEMRQFIGILFFMSVYRYPSIRSYWSEFSFQIIQNTMSRNRFDQIRSNLHFNDNNELPAKTSNEYDPLYKVRPLIKHFNGKFKSVPMPQQLCVDEQMCATKMKSFIRQYMPNKPHKWGIKLFVLCDTSGFCYSFEVFGGAGDNVVQAGNPDLGASSNVVIRLPQIVPEFKNHILYFDNYYTALPLLVYLRSRGIYSLGTIRSNRIPNCKLPTDKELKIQPRGYSTEYCGSALNVDISLTVWKDNKVVRLASTYAGVKPFKNENSQTVSRFVRSEKKYIDIDCPNVINEYNMHMGGVDHMVGMIGRYKIPWKTNKYTNRIFTHLLDVAMVNAYILYHKINKPDPKDTQYQLPSFRAQVAHVLCTLHSSGTSMGPGRPRGIPKSGSLGKKTYMPPVEVRYDGIGHFPHILPRQGGKRTCKNVGCNSQTQVVCLKCDIHLCLTNNSNCFYDFHHK